MSDFAADIRTLREELRQANLAIADLNARMQRVEARGGSTTAPARREMQNRGGHPGKYPWEKLWEAALRYEAKHKFTDDPQLRRVLREHVTKWPDQPSEPVLRNKLTQISDAVFFPDSAGEVVDSG
jgi:hypothetical protein